MTGGELSSVLKVATGELTIDGIVTGDVIVPAGTKVTKLMADIEGRLICGGYTCGAPTKMALSEPAGSESHSGTGETRTVGTLLVEGDALPVLNGFTFVGSVDAKGHATGVYATHCVDCTFVVNVKNASRHGVMLSECAGCLVTGEIQDIGVKTQTGTGYGVEFSSCSACTAAGIWAYGVRYGVTLSRGSTNCIVSILMSDATVAAADVHGSAVRPLFNSISQGGTGVAIKLGNESWGYGVVGEVIKNVAQEVVRIGTTETD